MARLIVEAVPFYVLTNYASLFVSVSRADDGTSVTGLTKDNFRISYAFGQGSDPTLTSVESRKWEPADSVSSGCYVLGIQPLPVQNQEDKTYFALGIEARIFGEMPSRVGGLGNLSLPVDFGQTVVAMPVPVG